MIKELTQIILDWYSEDKNFIEDYIIKDEIFFGVFSNLNCCRSRIIGSFAGAIERSERQFLTSIAQEMKAKLLEGDISEEDWQTFLAKINEWINNSDLKLKIDVDTKGIITGADEQKKLAAQTQKAWDMAAQSVGNLSTALNSIEDPAAKAAGTVIKAIADIALGFAQASVQAGSMGPWGWVAWLAAGTAALASTISTVHSLTGFANGGIVGHASCRRLFCSRKQLSDDNTPILANAGEVVLNRAQNRCIGIGTVRNKVPLPPARHT